jgi:hypothetical protein
LMLAWFDRAAHGTPELRLLAGCAGPDCVAIAATRFALDAVYDRKRSVWGFSWRMVGG